jgi:hypothetical protein
LRYLVHRVERISKSAVAFWDVGSSFCWGTENGFYLKLKPIALVIRPGLKPNFLQRF